MDDDKVFVRVYSKEGGMTFYHMHIDDAIRCRRLLRHGVWDDNAAEGILALYKPVEVFGSIDAEGWY